jgi:hypothetical protein
MFEAIALCEEISGRKLTWSYEETNRIGDHIWWISDVTKFQKHYPAWKFCHGLRQILEEIHRTVTKRMQSLRADPYDRLTLHSPAKGSVVRTPGGTDYLIKGQTMDSVADSLVDVGNIGAKEQNRRKGICHVLRKAREPKLVSKNADGHAIGLDIFKFSLRFNLPTKRVDHGRGNFTGES